MIVLSGALVLVALVLLVFGAVDRNLPYVYASIGVSVLSLLLLLVGVLQRRGELDGDDEGSATTPVTDASTGRVPALVGGGQEQSRTGPGDGDARTAELPVPVAVPAPVPDEEPARPASRRVVPDRAEDEPQDVELQDVEPQYVEPQHVEPQHVEPQHVEPQHVENWDDQLDEHELVEHEGSGVSVLVVSGRPRYHLEGCRVLRNKEPQALDREDARTHGFSPCGVCKPDADETAAQDQDDAVGARSADDGTSFTEALFGASLFADPQVTAESAERPDRPAQPVRPDADPAPVEPERRPGLPASEPADGMEPPPELHGEDPADHAALEADAGVTAGPSTDVAADRNEPVEASDPEPARLAEEPDGGPDQPYDRDDDVSAVTPADVDEPVVEPAEPVGPVEPVELGAAAGVPDADPVAPAAVQPPVQAEPPPGRGPAVGAVEPVAQVPAAVAEVPPASTGPTRSRRIRSKAPARPAIGAASTPTKAVRSPAKRAAPSDGAAAASPAKKIPAKTIPAKKIPAKPVPAEQVPAKQALAEKAPAKQATANKAPAKQASPSRAAAAPAPEPQVTRPLVRTVRADALRPSVRSTGVTTTRVSARAATPAIGGAVVVVPDRERFHRPECRFVRAVAGATRLPKSSATRQGYIACGVCKP